MSFEEQFEAAQKEMGSTSEFYKFTVGRHVMRIMSEPQKKASRFGHGICYPGAPYCDPAVLQKEWEQKAQAYAEECKLARDKGATERDIKLIKKPSRPNISVKWSVWALIRATGELAIVDLPNGVAEKLLGFKRDEDEMGTAFEAFPMPYDVKIVVTRKKVANPGPKDIEYDIVPGTKHTEVTEAESALLAQKVPIEQIIERMNAKAQEKYQSEADGYDGIPTEEQGGHIEYPQEDINPDDIPF